MTLATLGTLGEAQELDQLAQPERYQALYAPLQLPALLRRRGKPLRGQSRREIGHGALAERALEPVIPDEETFPYTIRLVSECCHPTARPRWPPSVAPRWR